MDCVQNQSAAVLGSDSAGHEINNKKLYMYSTKHLLDLW